MYWDGLGGDWDGLGALWDGLGGMGAVRIVVGGGTGRGVDRWILGALGLTGSTGFNWEHWDAVADTGTNWDHVDAGVTPPTRFGSAHRGAGSLEGNAP